jgi:hypothetical protein
LWVTRGKGREGGEKETAREASVGETERQRDKRELTSREKR